MFPFDDSLTFDEMQGITKHESKRVIAVTGGKVSDMGLINEVCMDIYAQVEMCCIKLNLNKVAVFIRKCRTCTFATDKEFVYGEKNKRRIIQLRYSF